MSPVWLLPMYPVCTPVELIPAHLIALPEQARRTGAGLRQVRFSL